VSRSPSALGRSSSGVTMSACDSRSRASSASTSSSLTESSAPSIVSPSTETASTLGRTSTFALKASGSPLAIVGRLRTSGDATTASSCACTAARSPSSTSVATTSFFTCGP